jgi:putative tryptophan/tyrosine transport system substrate-binding protein
MRRRDFLGLMGGAAIGLPLPMRAQRGGKSYRIGYLALLPGEDATFAKPFLQRLQELGYGAGKNLTFEYRSADGKPERLAELAAELVKSNPDVLVAGGGTLAAKAAAAATRIIPVVFTAVGDPVGAGLVTSLSQPGANVTGMSAQASNIAAKQLQILKDLLQSKQTIAVLSNPDTPNSALALREIKLAASAADQPVALFEARTPDAVAASVEAAIRSGAAGLLVVGDPLLYGARRDIIGLVAKARLPTLYGGVVFAEAGGLMSYGAEGSQISRRAAEYVDKILQGARPADLPVEQATKLEFVVNLKTAKEQAIVLPPTLLAIADRVIE